MPSRVVEHFQPHVVPAFGGGLNLPVHPAYLRDDQASWMSGWICRDGYAETANTYGTLVTNLGAAGEVIVGMVQNPFTQDGAIVGTIDASGPPAALRLYGVTGAGVVTTIAAAAVGGKGTRTGVLRGAFVGGQLVLFAGAAPGAANGLVYDGTTVLPVSGVTADFIVGFKSHVVLGVVPENLVIDATAIRRAAWSASDDPQTYSPSVANDADFFVADDADSGIVGLVPMSSELVGVLTRSQVYVLVPTGGIPAFTRQLLISGIGCQQIASASFTTNRRQSFFGSTPYGAAFYGADNIYLTAGGIPQPVGTPVFRYFSQIVDPNLDPANDYNQSWVWHEGLGTLIVPRIVTGSAQVEGLYFHARTQAWSRVQWPAQLFTRGAFIYGYSTGSLQRRHWMSFGRSIQIEDFNTVFPNAFIDTKDFALPEPTRDQYVDRIKVDWEPLTDGTNDAIQIFCATHNDLAPNVLGSNGLETQALPFTLLGTLTGGKSELAVRRRAKYIRFRIQQSNGRMRIRGLTLLRRRGSPRRT